MSNFKSVFDEAINLVGLGKRGIAVGETKGEILFNMARLASLFPGDMAEVGSYMGGSAKIICQAAPQKTLRVFDTFEGIPSVDETVEPKEWLGAFNDVTAYETCCRVLSGEDAIIYKGVFPKSAKLDCDTSYCFVHADADVFKSTWDICEFFYDKMSAGGIILFDDYGYEKATGCKLAVDRFFKDRHENPALLSTGQVVVIKNL